MRIGLKYITPALAAGAAAVAIAAAPTAMAATTDAPVFPHEQTTLVGPLPGNNQINASPPVDFAPQYPYWDRGYGGYHGGYHGGYGHSGGFGGGHGGGHR
jgi:hypothetical protein